MASMQTLTIPRETTPPAAPMSLPAIGALCKAAADPVRLQVLRVLCNDSLGVSELCAILDMRQPALSHHLKVLATAGLVASRREGNSIFYRRNGLAQQGALEDLQHHLYAAIDSTELPVALRRRMTALYRQREENSRNFFRDNAEKFRQQQDLIAGYDLYADTVAEVLREAPVSNRRLALEVGPGDGAFLTELSPLFERVIALDNSPVMLAKATEQALTAGLQNVEFVLGDTGAPALAEIRADCVVINMVLHHTPSPARILQDIATCLAPGGVVLITELCRHDQDWARDNCGDLWLGFEPADLDQWAADVGLTDKASIYLAQRNGFQVQVRLFGRH